MNILYGIEPDTCIINHDILRNNSLDIVLPKYFLTQINYLQNRDFGNATEAANKIINSLNQWENSDLLLFKTNAGGTVYFIDEVINYLKIERQYQNLDNTNPLNRYLLSLLYLSEILEAKIVFLVSSPEFIYKCQVLNFDTVTLEEFTFCSESWLRPEMLVNLQINNSNTIGELDILDTSETQISIGIKWQDIAISQGISNIEWINLR